MNNVIFIRGYQDNYKPDETSQTFKSIQDNLPKSKYNVT